VADAFLAVDAELTRLGYEHYEISNFARPLQRSLHNQQYWWGFPYLGLGAGAVGTIERDGQVLRYRNPQNVKTYLQRQLRTDSSALDALDEVEILDAETRLRERLMLGLRLREGVDLKRLGDELGLEPLSPERRRAIQRLVAQKRLSLAGSRCYIQPEAWLLADGTIAQLM
jgi:oxygen-independent coproporphyrinogen-3 oxidase